MDFGMSQLEMKLSASAKLSDGNQTEKRHETSSLVEIRMEAM